MRLRLLFLLLFTAGFATAETVRVATYNVSLGRRGPGVLLKHIVEGDEQVLAVISVIQTVRPDILVMQEFDHDDHGLALAAFRDALAVGSDGIEYPYWFAPRGNEGRPSFIDLDGDGREDRWSDTLGFGKFPGSEGMAMLSRYPIVDEDIRTFTNLLWKDAPGAVLPVSDDGVQYLSDEALDMFPMSYRAHWDVPVSVGDQIISVLAMHASPPVFDGVENLNGLRNATEVGFWGHYLDGEPVKDDADNIETMADHPFVLIGDFNVDTLDGEGLHDPIIRLLSHPKINDVEPASEGAVIAEGRTANANAAKGDPALDTVNWGEDIGNMRVDYVLPSVDLRAEAASVVWPDNNDLFFETAEAASHHRLVWVDIDFSAFESDR